MLQSWSTYSKIAFIICVFVCSLQCNNTRHDELDAPSKSYVSEKYSHDSAYYVHTVKELIRLDDRYFWYYKREKLNPDIFVDSLLYSEDTLKCIALIVVYTVETRIKEKPNEKYYVGWYMVGVRDSVGEPWTVYYLQDVPGGVFDTYQKIHDSFRNVLYRHFADIQEGCPTFCPDTVYPRQFDAIHHQKYVNINYGCNLGDPGFWTQKNLLWRKSVRRQGLYNFQTWHHQATPDQVKEDPHLVYPDSMLVCYRSR